MSDQDVSGSNTPSIGSAFTMEVVSAANRTTFFPDQTVVTGIPQKFIELILLRTEPVVLGQIGTVASVGDEVKISDIKTDVKSQLFDIAHVRLPFNLAASTAVAILRQTLPEFGAELDRFEQRLTQTSEQPT